MLDQQLKTIVVKSYVVRVKSRVEISQNFVAFSEYMNFKKIGATKCLQKGNKLIVSSLE